MLIIFGTLILIASVILGLIILIQNPKGGGLSASFGGVGNQLMGVKKTTDVLEKGTWLFAGIVAVLCLTSAIFIPKTGLNSEGDNLLNQAPAGTATPKQNTAPLQTPQPLPSQPAQPAASQP